MTKQTQGSMALIGAIAGGIFLVAFVALMIVGQYTFSPALFLAGTVAAAVAVHSSAGQGRLRVAAVVALVVALLLLGTLGVRSWA